MTAQPLGGEPIEFTPREFVNFAVQLRGKPFSLNLRPWLKSVYDLPFVGKNPRRKMLLVFGRQSEKSTTISNLFLSLANLIPYLRLLYVTASNEQMREFSDDKLRAIIKDSPMLMRMSGQVDLAGATRKEVQNVQTKRWLNQSKIVLRSVFKSPDRCRGISADVLACDELQDIYADFMPVIEQTLFHSEMEGGPLSIYCGTPKSFDNNLEILWSRHSTQNEWVIKCKGCNSWEVVEIENLGPRGLICKKCGRLLNPIENGQWARLGRQDSEWEGLRIPQPIVLYTSRVHPDAFQRRWDEMMQKKARYDEQQFQNEVMARSSDVGTKPVTFEQVRKCCTANSMIEEPTEQLKQAHTWAGIDWGCHDDQTEILTEDGWLPFPQLTTSHRVAQFDPTSPVMDFAHPSAITAKPYTGPLLHFKAKSVDMLLTPGHRMWARTQRGPWKESSAAETGRLSGRYFLGSVAWEGMDVDAFTLPGLPSSSGYSGCEPVTFVMDDWLELLGYWLSEAGLCFNGERPACIKMSQRKTAHPEVAAKMKKCLDRMGIPYKEFPNPKTGDLNWTIYGKQFWSWWQGNIGTSCDDKRIPRSFLSLSQRQLRILFESMLLGDGQRDKRSGATNGEYSSTSKQLTDDFQELALRLGLRTRAGLRRRATGNKKALYSCHFAEGHERCVRKKPEHVPYKGMVYCCTVPKGFIVTRRNGCIGLQGNTGQESYTVLSIWGYDTAGCFTCYYAKKYEGREADPEVAIHDIVKTCRNWRVNRIGADWGFGFYPNSTLQKVFSANKVLLYQHAGKQGEKVHWNPKAFHFTTHRTRVLQDIFSLIKRGPVARGISFPRWEQFEPFANDILGVFSEYSERRGELVFDHPRKTPDDFLHTAVYALLASQFDHRRPDLNAPGT